jgi:hypothetical protein
MSFNREEVELILVELKQLQDGYQRDLEDLSEINHKLIQWFAEGKRLQGNMQTVCDVVLRTIQRWSKIQQDLETALDDDEAADWWKNT